MLYRRHIDFCEVAGDTTIGTVGPQILPNVHGLLEAIADARLKGFLIEEESLLDSLGLVGGGPGGVHELRNPRIVKSRPGTGVDAQTKVIGDAVVVQVGTVVVLDEVDQIIPSVREGFVVAFQKINPYDGDEEISISHQQVNVGLSVLAIFSHGSDFGEDVLILEQTVGRSDAVIQGFQQTKTGCLRGERIDHQVGIVQLGAGARCAANVLDGIFGNIRGFGKVDCAAGAFLEQFGTVAKMASRLGRVERQVVGNDALILTGGEGLQILIVATVVLGLFGLLPVTTLCQKVGVEEFNRTYLRVGRFRQETGERHLCYVLGDSVFVQCCIQRRVLWSARNKSYVFKKVSALGADWQTLRSDKLCGRAEKIRQSLKT